MLETSAMQGAFQRIPGGNLGGPGVHQGVNVVGAQARPWQGVGVPGTASLKSESILRNESGTKWEQRPKGKRIETLRFLKQSLRIESRPFTN